MNPYPAQTEQLKNELLAQPNWQEKYRILLKVGKQAAPLDATKRHDANKVSGCEARVWLDACGDEDELFFDFYSDARLVHALIHVTLLPVQGQSATTISHFDAQLWLNECGLATQLSPSRSDGLQQVVQAAKRLALVRAADG